MFCRIKRWPILFLARIAKHYIWVNIRIQVPDTIAICRDIPLKRSNGLGVGRLATPPVVRSALLRAVAVHVHVDELAVLALHVDDAVAVEVIAAVRVVAAVAVFGVEAGGKHIVALALFDYVVV